MRVYPVNLAVVVVCCAIAVLSTATSEKNSTFLLTQKQLLQAQLTQLELELNLVQESIRAGEKQKSLSHYHKARKWFKKTEYLLAYYHSETVRDFINGAPLPKLEKNVNEHIIKPPTGFQRLEEILYSDEHSDQEALEIVKSLKNYLQDIMAFEQRFTYQRWQIFDAIQLEIIRITTQGITGFDTPSSDSAIAESAIAFFALEPASITLAADAGESYESEVRSLFDLARKHLKNQDFDNFDRLEFIREVAEPLYGLMKRIHKADGSEFYDETGALDRAYCDTSSSMFSTDLLNKSYFLNFSLGEITEPRIALGQKLFFDPILSEANTVACASCHLPQKAFTDGLAKSLSNDGKTSVNRNSPTLINSVFATEYFHDLRADRLEKQTEHVMSSSDEFNLPPLKLAEKLRRDANYAAAFRKAFPNQSEPIQPASIQLAISAYISSLTSWNSAFDKYIRKETEHLDPSAKRGFNLFMGKAACGTCHFAPTFSGLLPPYYDDSESEVLGATATNDTLRPTLDNDLGRSGNKIRADAVSMFDHSFKTPTVRNVELTAPYFHNGSFPTLEEVMWFYKKGGGAGLGLDVPNQTLPFDSLELSKAEIADIIAFMKALTDLGGFDKHPN